MDTKSVTGLSIENDSYDSKSVGSRARNEQKRARHMQKLKRRMEDMPTRQLLFRPKVYDYWREGELDDEIAERQRLLADIAAKEERLQARRRRRGGDGEEEYNSDSSEENQTIKALDRLKSRKEREEDYKRRLEEVKKRREEDEAMKLEEKLLSELQNPSVFGWYYTDGYYDNAPYFGVREDLVPKLAAEQEEWREKWSNRYPENFTDKFKRLFWPPKMLCKGKTFRTRGSYMDFPEVISDWPKIPADVSFEREPREYITNRHELFGLTEEQLAEDANELEAANLEAALEGQEEGEEEKRKSTLLSMLKLEKPIPPGMDLFGASEKDIDAYNYYYDDDTGEFYRKKIGFDVEYYFDGFCWRHKKKRGKFKSENQQAPYDFYFDDSSKNFLPREEYRGIDEIVYDHKTSVFRIHLITKPEFQNIKTEKKTKGGRTVLDLPNFKEEPTTDDDADTTLGPDKKKYKSTSYYFDEEYGKWFFRGELPEGVTSKDVQWDENGKRHTRKFEGPWRGLTGLSPDDYYFDDRGSRFQPKPARQGESFKYYSADGVWRRGESKLEYTARSDDVARFYFDDFEGQFKQKDVLDANAKFIQGKYTKIWRKIPKPKNGMYPTDYYWDTNKKRWLPRVVRLEMMKNAEIERARKIMTGQQQTGIFWELKQNDNSTKDDFFFDYEEGIFLKKNNKEDYIFDDDDNCWKPNSMKDKPKQHRYHHEFYFDLKENGFLLKGSDNYEYDQKYHVWKIGNADLSNAEIKNWHYDLTQERWLDTKIDAVRLDPMLGINVVPHSDPNFRSPCDFYFNPAEGRFFAKEADMANYYVYDPGNGSWTLKSSAAPKGLNNLTPRSFFWDDQTRSFKLKVTGRDKDYYYDGRNKLFRSIVASGRTKSGFRPKDFFWNSEFRTYIPTSFIKKARGNVVDDLPTWDPMRTYEKPWVTAAPMRNPDSTKKEERKKSVEEAKSGWFGSGKNKVAPSKDKKK